MQRRLNRRVLVIEDDTDIRKLIADALTGVGLDVVSAVDAGQALRTVLARKRLVANDVPIVIVSGRSDRREIASLLGATYVCGKPFEVDELVGEVERAVLN